MDIIASKCDAETSESKVRIFRWLLYISLVQLLAFFIVPPFSMIRSGTPIELIPYIEILAALTVGLIFALFILVVSVCGVIIDRRRRTLYVVTTVIMVAWILWAVISWTYIEYMDYLL